MINYFSERIQKTLVAETSKILIEKEHNWN